MTNEIPYIIGNEAESGESSLEGDMLQAYLQEIRSYRRLSADEEQHLARQVAAGRNARAQLQDPTLTEEQRASLREMLSVAEAAQQRLVATHLSLVVRLARQFARRGVPLLDLIQEGNIGLLQAIERFDPQRGVRLATYAAWWIQQAIKRALADQVRPLHVPSQSRALLTQLYRTQAQLAQELGREPTTAEVAMRLGVPEQQIEDIWPLLHEPLSLEAPVSNDEETVLKDLIPDSQYFSLDEIVVDRLAHEYLRSTLGALDSLEQQVLSLRYGLNDGRFCSLDEVAQQLGLRREQIRQIEGRALRKLRQPSFGAGLGAIADEALCGQ